MPRPDARRNDQLRPTVLERNANPSLADVKTATSGNLCRCGTYPKVFEATLAAAKKMNK